MEDGNFDNCDSLVLEEEPKLKYDRLANDVKNILTKDAVSCISVHPKFICLGSQWGKVYLLDHQGNIVSSSGSNVSKETAKDRDKKKPKDLYFHSIAVNRISVDTNGDYVASCSDDGTIIIRGLYSSLSENNHNLSLGRMIKSIALDPSYHKPGSGRRFLIGDNKLTLYEKSFLSRIKSTVLSECEGYVQTIAWQDRFVAWASDVGVRVYDLVARCSLGLMKWDLNKATSNQDFRCNLVWSAERTLMIGWVDIVRICLIRKRNSTDPQTRVPSDYVVDPIYTFPSDYYISGLAPLDNQLVILGFPKEVHPITGKYQRPNLCIIDYKECEVNTSHEDCLNILGYEKYTCNEYHLLSVIEENRFFIVSPKEILVASQYDIDERVQWLMEHDFYERAMSVLEKAGGRTSKHSVSSVGILYMDSLLNKNEFEKAAMICFKVCSDDRSLWEDQIYKFSELNQLRSISRWIPMTLERKLGSKIYEMILYEYLKFDPPGFLLAIKNWNPGLYNMDAVTNVVTGRVILADQHKAHYMESLAVLYCHQKQYDKALSMYLKLQHPDVFEVIEKYDLYKFIHDKILKLMNLDSKKTIALLVKKSTKNQIPVEVVEKQLEKEDNYLVSYLHELSKVDLPSKYHGRLVKLYADNSRDKLLPFLRFSDSYPIEDALDICKKKDYFPETVYLLDRIGSTKDALNIIIQKLNDTNQAINFCQEHNDNELWQNLINQSLDKPESITLLLKRIGNYVDPRVLIQGIKPGCEIPNLKDSLGKMMSDYNLQLSVQEACKAITVRNYFDLHEKFVNSHQKGVLIYDENRCSVCNETVIVKDLSHARDVIVYNCRHTFHISCLGLPRGCLGMCGVCNSVKN